MGLIGAACGSNRPVLSVDVTSDVERDGVTLRLTVGTAIDRTFAPVNLSPTTPFRAGLYLNGSRGAVTLTGEADNGTCIVASQSIAIPDIEKVSGATKLVLMTQTGCRPPRGDAGIDAAGGDTSGTGGSVAGTGGASGAGGFVTESGGASGTGGSVTGTGGANSGTGGAGTGGAGIGSGGAGGIGRGGSSVGGRGTGGIGIGGAHGGGTGNGGRGSGGMGIGGKNAGGGGSGGMAGGGAGGAGGRGMGGSAGNGDGSGGAGGNAGGAGGAGGNAGGAGGAGTTCVGWGAPANMCRAESDGFSYTCNCPGSSGCLYYRFADSACSTCSPYSCSGYSPNGAVYGPIGNDPRFASCQCTSCVNDLSNIGTGDFNIMFTLTTSTTKGEVINQRAACGNGQFWDVRTSATGTLWVETDDGSGTNNYTLMMSSVVVADGNHHDVVITRLNGTLLLSIDGVEHETAGSSANFGALAPLATKTGGCTGSTDGTVVLAGAVTNICVNH